MGSFIAAWLVAEGILIFTHYRANAVSIAGKASYASVPPIGPTSLILTSGPFILLALLAEAPQARSLATLIAWGIDIAAFLALTSGKVGWPSTSGGWPPAMADNSSIFPTGQSAVQSATPTSATTSVPPNTPPLTA